MKIIGVIVKELPDGCFECIFYINKKCILVNEEIPCVYFESSYRYENCLLIKDRRLKRKDKDEN